MLAPDPPSNLKDRRRKNIRIRETIREKIVHMTKLSGFKVPTLNSGFKIFGDMSKPGSFCFGLNGKTNPVLKRSGFVTNPEQFPLV